MTTNNTFFPRVKIKYPEFENHAKMFDVLGWHLAYSSVDIDSFDWFLQFYERLIKARDKKEYLPLFRMGDGEYTFLLGDNIYSITPYHKLRWKQKLLKFKLSFVKKEEGHSSGTNTDGKESYTEFELKSLKKKFIDCLRFISTNGILGLGLDNGKFYGKYMPYIKEAFDSHNIILNKNNYYHVYHVYALFGSSFGEKLLRNQHVLIVTSLNDEKKAKFREYLRKIGVKKVSFYGISPDKSMLDIINTNEIEKDVNIALVGAGVGSVNILCQLEPLSIPSLDIGTVLGNMLDPDRIYLRPFMANDNKFDLDKIKFITEKKKDQLRKSGLF